MTNQTYLTLPSGQKMPALGLGTWQATDEAELEAAVDTALESGYRHIDTAWLYQNEIPIGRVLKRWLESGRIKREDVFITTKLPMIAVHPDRVKLFIKKSLANLQLDYIDLYLIHFPVCFKYREGLVLPPFTESIDELAEPKTDHVGVWKKLEEQVDAGRARNIGLSNYNVQQISTIMNSARIKPASLQVELHAYLQQRQLVDFCRRNGIAVVAYGPLTNPNLNTFLMKKGHESKKFPTLLSDPEVKKLADKYSKTPAQIALRFLLQCNVSPIPKSVSPIRIKENFDVFDFILGEDDMKVLYNLERGEKGRLFDLKFGVGIEKHPDYPLKNSS